MQMLLILQSNTMQKYANVTKTSPVFTKHLKEWIYWQKCPF